MAQDWERVQTLLTICTTQPNWHSIRGKPEIHLGTVEADCTPSLIWSGGANGEFALLVMQPEDCSWREQALHSKSQPGVNECNGDITSTSRFYGHLERIE